MAERRDRQRVNCAEKCFLYHEENKYCGAIMNISISGALVTLGSLPHSTIKAEDTCSFVLSGEPSTSFCRYRGQIVRVNLPEIGLKIVEPVF